MDIEGKSSFQRSVYTEFFELVTNFTMEVKSHQSEMQTLSATKGRFVNLTVVHFGQ